MTKKKIYIFIIYTFILFSSLISAKETIADTDVESFESSLGDWPNASGNKSNWIRKSGSTSSGSTGPSGAYDGSYYIYVETSSGSSYYSGNTDIVEFTVPCGAGSGTIDFYYHQYGSNQGTLYLEGYDGSWNNIWSTSINSNAWYNENQSFSNYTKLRFRNVAAGGYRGDIALDKITVDYSCSSGCPTDGSIITSSCTFENNLGTTTDEKQIVGLHNSDGSTNISTLRVSAGSTLSINSNQKLIAGSIDVSGDSGSIVILEGGSIDPGVSVWYPDDSCDTTPIISKTNPGGYINYDDCVLCSEIAGSCSDDTDCCEGYCADNVCCNTPCDGTCQRCDSYDGTAGTCHLISQGNDPDNECVSSWECGSNCQRRRYEGCDGDSAACEDETYTYDNIAQGYVCENGNEVDPYYLWDYCDTDPAYCASWTDCEIRTDAYSCNGSGSCTYQEITIGSDVSDGYICQDGSEVVAACDANYSCFYNRHLCQKACGDVNAYEDCNWPVNCTTCTEYCESGACQTDDACEGITSVNYRGKTYSTVEIGNQCWLAENLNVGNLIMLNEEMGSDCPSPDTDIQKWCVNENEAGCDTYGGLYTWNQAMCEGYWGTELGAKGICPEGWHVPTRQEFYTLATFYTDPTVECEYSSSYGKQDCSGPSLMGSYDLWESYTGSSYDWIDARNAADFGNSGWDGIPGGYKYSTLSVSSVGYYGEFWSSKSRDSSDAHALILGYGYPYAYRDYDRDKTYGYSVRCIKNDNSDSDMCQTCTCDGTGYQTITCNGDTVYVDCSTDICWAPGVDYDERARTYTAEDRILEVSYAQNNDWMMPDKDTLQAMCQNQCVSGTCFGDANSNYGGVNWAKPEGGYYWYVDFSDCSIHDELDTFETKEYGYMRVQSVDSDGDGYYSEATGGGDCNDSNASVNPGQTEVCGNGLDDNCDLNDCLSYEEYPCSEIGTIPNCDTMCGTGQDVKLGTCSGSGLTRPDIACRWVCDTQTCESIWGDHCNYSGDAYYGMKCGRTLEEGTDCYACTGTPYSYEGYEEIIGEQDGDWYDPGTDWVGCCTGAVCCCSMH